jgi:hypothetical protein
LEPACGDGNFLTEILRRKLNVVIANYGNNFEDFEKYAVLAVTSIYGIDILSDNVAACIIRLFDIFDDIYTSHLKKNATDDCRNAVRFILNLNIICGYALTMETNEKKPIVFSKMVICYRRFIQTKRFLFKRNVKRTS